MVIFTKVRWKNFLSTGNTFTEIQLDQNPSTLVVGENGAGKSTILDALCFALFNKPFRQISKSQLLNSINQREAIVEVEFNTQNKEIKIVRGIKPNVFEIYVDGVMINQNANAKDYQKHLEQQILKFNYRSFTQVVILGSSTFVPFMQLRSQARREVVEDILDIKIFSLMNLVLKTKVREINTNLTDTKYSQDLTQNKIELQEKYIEDSKNNRDNLLTEKTNLISTNEEEISENKERETELQKSTNTFLEAMKGEDVVITKRDRLKDVQFSLKDKHNRESTLITFFQENNECPTCEQHIDETFKSEKIKQNQTSVEKLEEGLNKMSDEMKKVEDKLKEYKKLSKAIQKNEVEMQKYRSTITQLEKFNSTLESEIKQLLENEIGKEDIKKLDKLREKLYSIDLTSKKYKEELFYFDVAKNLLQDTGIKTKIVKQYLPIMNKLVNTYLSSMDFFCNFNLDENFNETIKSRYRDDFSYANFSEGEKMRIDLALLFTWRAIAKMKNSTNTNLLILDEIFDSSLDASGTDDFLKILNTFDKENVFVISHKQDMLFDKFRHTIKFEKSKNFSKVA
jgi:DNA repair exonuclease SbcCD ATPase subunit